MSDGRNVPVVSFKGLGKVQRRVLRALIANPHSELTTSQLACWAFPESPRGH